MKTRIIVLLAFCAWLNPQASSFINLDFEMVNTNTTTFIPTGGFLEGYGPIEDLLQGWQMTYGNQTVTEIGFNGGGSPNSPGYADIIYREAYYSESIFAQGDHVLKLYYIDEAPYVLTQRADIPVGAVVFAIDGRVFLPWELRLNGTLIDRDGDISAFQGQKNVEFSLTVFSPELPGIPTPYWTYIDSISFVVPEPSTGLLFLVGGLAMGWFLCRGRWK